MKLFPKSGTTVSGRPAGSPPASAGGMRTGFTRDYVGGYPDEVVEEFGAEDGDAAIHNPAVWGDSNNRPWSLHLFNEGHGTATHLVGDVMRDDVQKVATDVEHKVPAHATAAANATQASDENKTAQVRKLALTAKLSKLGLEVPDPRAIWKSLGILLGLFIGDWALIAVSYQLLGLSDQPWIPGFAASDDLHLAALASVVALVILAHGVGVKIRRMEHDARQRRVAVDVAARERLPRVSVLDMVLTGLFLTVAVFAVIGIGAIRIDYLAASGVPANAFPFMVIQLAILAAAIVVTYGFAHPLEREWRASESATAKTDKMVVRCVDVLDLSTGSLNADIDLIGAIVAKAGHNVGADEANVRRQGGLFVRRATLSQPETTTEQLFPDELPVPTHLDAEQLLAELTGITALPAFVRVTTEAFHAHHAANLEAVRRVAALLEKVELAEVFDADELDDLEVSAPVAPLTAVAKVDEEDAA